MASHKHSGKVMDGSVRVSRKGSREDASFYSPGEQAQQIAAWATANGVTLGEIFEDIDWSGGTMQRPGFLTARKRIRERESVGLIVARLDRFGRDTEGMLEVEREIRAAGGVLVNLDGEFDTTTPEGELMFTNFAGMATYTRRTIQRGWQRTHERNVTDGVPTRAAFGYRRREDVGAPLEGRHPKTLVPYLPESQHVESVFAARARGESFGAIAATLNARGVPTSSGAAWASGSVSALIRSRTYLGEVKFGDSVNATAHEPLVSEALWHAAQVGGARANPSNGGSLLTGIVRCAGCRYALESSVAMDRYRCAGKHAGGTCPEPVSIRRHLLDEYVWNYMVRRVEEERLALEGHRVADAGARETVEAELRAARVAEDAFLDNLDAIAVLGQARWNEQAARHRTRVAALERRLGEVTSIEIAAGDAPDWTALDRAPLEVKRSALAHGLDVVFLRGHAGRGGTGVLDPSRVLILERGQGPSREQLPRRGPRAACEFACVPFPFPDDRERPAVLVGREPVAECLQEHLGAGHDASPRSSASHGHTRL
jgi:DNA invertase Pin-like site-specific DNA recombinase